MHPEECVLEGCAHHGALHPKRASSSKKINSREGGCYEDKITCASVLALALSSTSSLAQDAGSNNPQSSQDATGLQDIVVTAQRKSESLQRAAIAVTAISTEALTAKVTKGEDFASLVPSVVIGAGGGGTNLVAIRGIGTLASNGLTENVVAFNLDGVYLARPAAANALFYDLERVEVLKGLQGTLYATVATGFKAGGFYASLTPNTFKPEKLTAYTLGSKNRFLDNRLQFNLELYYWKYDDKQVSHLGPVRPAGFNLITENAGNATIYGAEMEASFLATPDDLFSTNVLFNHTKYDSFVYNQTIAVGPPSTTCAILPPTAGQPATTVNVDCSGNVLQQAPKWSVNVGYEHTFRLANDGKVVFAAQGQFRSSYWLGDEHLVGQQQGNYATADAQLTYHAPEDRWTVGSYIQNIGDKAVMTQSVAQPILGQPVVGLYPPRTYGVRAGLRF